MEPSWSAKARKESQVAEALRRIASLRPQVWDNMEVDDRLRAMQEAENIVATLYRREPANVFAYSAAPGDYRYYDGENNQLGIGSYSLEHDDVSEVVDTLLHESRHAYQQWVVDHPETHGDPIEAGAWQENIAHYALYEDDPVRYMEQPVEADARQFSQAIVNRLFGGAG